MRTGSRRTGSTGCGTSANQTLRRTAALYRLSAVREVCAARRRRGSVPVISSHSLWCFPEAHDPQTARGKRPHNWPRPESRRPAGAAFPRRRRMPRFGRERRAAFGIDRQRLGKPRSTAAIGCLCRATSATPPSRRINRRGEPRRAATRGQLKQNVSGAGMSIMHNAIFSTPAGRCPRAART